MDILIVIYWLLIFTIIILYLGGLTYFIQQKYFTDKFQLDIMNQQEQGRRNSTNHRRRNPRNGNRKNKQLITTNTNSNCDNTKKDEQKLNSSETTIEQNENEQQQSDKEQEHEEEFHNTNKTQQDTCSSTHIEIEQEPTLWIKQGYKIQNNNEPSNLPITKEENVVPSKPQASVAPVKQNPSAPLLKNSSNNLKFSQNHQDTHLKSNGYLPSSYNNYSYPVHNPLPPRFQQQRQQQRQQQKSATSSGHRYRKRREPLPSKKSSLPPGSAARSNDFIPSVVQQQQEQQQHHHHQEQQQQHHHHHQEQQHYQEQQQQQQPQIYNNQIEERSVNFVQQHEPSINNGYSSESDILTDAPSNGGNNSFSPLLSTSAGSQSSLQRLDLVRSLSISHDLLDELVSIFDTISFSSEELELILNKIATKHYSDKHDLQRLISSAKSDKTFERILDETYRSQAKILAIELQIEKNRVLELTKTNGDMENTIRQLHQQPNNMVQYQQMILPFQMQLRRLTDENARLQHQLHAYSMLPATINDLKQQQHVLNEQIRQINIRNSALENEVAESERASKHAAEIYKKADTQKQQRIEQMIADINRYTKLDKELTNLRQKHNELEKDLNSKVTEMTHQRDELQAYCDHLKEKVQQYDQLQIKYNQLLQNQTNNLTDEIQQELNDLKSKNDQLRQDNWKNMQELNKSLNETQSN